MEHMRNRAADDRPGLRSDGDGHGLIVLYLTGMGYDADRAEEMADTLVQDAAGDVCAALICATALPGPQAEWPNLPDAVDAPLTFRPQDLSPILIRRLARLRRVQQQPSANSR